MYVGYVRVSHVGGRGGESFRSPDDQAAAIRAYADREGLAIEVLPPELDESGGRADRPILMQAVEGIEAGRYEGLIVYDFSRYFRSVLHSRATTLRIESAGGVVISTTEQLPPGALGGFLNTMIEGSNEFYREQAAERFERLRVSSAERGIWKFRQVPTGYMLAGPRPTGLVPGPDAPEVKAAFAARLTVPPTPLTTIAARLSMTASGVRALLRNRVYLGEIHVGRHVNREAHEALVDRQTFDAVGAMATVRPARGVGGALLAGLARCGGCGHVMTLNRSGVGSYRCKGDHSAGPCPAPATIGAAKIGAHVSDSARTEIEVLQFATARRTGEGDALRSALADAGAELSAYLDGTSAAGLGFEAFAQGARKRQQSVDDARAALDAYHALAPLAGLFESGGDFFDDLTVHEKNRLLRGLIDAVVVRAVGRGRDVAVGQRVRIFKRGALGDLTYRGGGAPMPVERMPFPHGDDERLLGVASGKDRRRRAGR